MTRIADFDNMTCPTTRNDYERVLLGHGSGGKLSADLIRRVFLSQLGNDVLSALEDSATLTIDSQSPAMGDNQPADRRFSRIAFTTDSFVVKPLFFPGGDIGKLAVHGTVNDLAVSGATPLYLSAAFILEEGFEIEQLRRIVVSMREACAEAGVTLVTGDTKVVDRGKGDQVFITTTGIGMHTVDHNLSIRNARAGDRVIVSGTIGDHGMTIMSTRESIEFETALESDTAPLNDLTQTMLSACPSIRVMRDPTRGGISSTLNELATASEVGIVLDEASIPVRPEVHSACEMLGLDPMYVANEGKLIVVIPDNDVKLLLDVMQSHPLGRDSAVIGEVVQDHAGMVVMRSLIGGQRVVTMLSGEQLPRIC
jgi:hydrogenase expression/formation protein HypE